jgi:FERM N-terminal domain
LNATVSSLKVRQLGIVFANLLCRTINRHCTAWHLVDDVLFRPVCLLLQKTANGQALFDKVCQHISLFEVDYFSLSFRDVGDVKVSKGVFSSLHALPRERIFRPVYRHYGLQIGT